MKKDKKKLAIFNLPECDLVTVHTDKLADKRIELDMKKLQRIIDRNDIKGYQNVANQLLFAVITTGEKHEKECSK
jgi:hypothetical protein